MANIINFNKDNQQDKQGQTPQQQSMPAPIAPVAAPTQQSSSGQFTNIQKYLGANKGAGQQVAQGVTSRLEKNIAPEKQQQASAAQQFRASVDKSNDVFNRGQQYQSQLSQPAKAAEGITTPGAEYRQQPSMEPGLLGDIANSSAMTKEQVAQGIQPVSAQQAQTFDPNSIVGDTQKLQDFTNLRLGGGVNEDQLKSQADTSQLLSGLLQQKSTEDYGRTGTSAGRSGLVMQAFNRPSYSQGQQRLDNLFLSGSKGAIGDVRKAAQQNVNQARDIASQATAGVQQSRDIASKEQDMQKSLQEGASGLESSYLKSLESLIPKVNQERQAEQDRWLKNFNILKGQEQGSINQDIYDQLGLRTGEHSFGVLDDKDLGLRNIAQISEQQAANAGDVANQSDVDYYNMLAKLSKGSLDASGKYVGPNQDQLSLQGPSQLTDAVKVNQGENSLRGMLDRAQKQFDEYARNTNVIGRGQDTGNSSIFGGGGTAVSQMQANLADYLEKSYTPTYAGASAPGMGDAILSAIGGTAGSYGGNALFGPAGGIAGGAIGGALGSGINNAITGGSSGSASAAANEARRNFMDNALNTLVNQKYGNYITSSGVKNTNDLLQQQRAIDEGTLDFTNRYGGYLGSNAEADARNVVSNRFRTDQGSAPTMNAESLIAWGKQNMADSPIMKTNLTQDAGAYQQLMNAYIDSESKGELDKIRQQQMEMARTEAAPRFEQQAAMTKNLNQELLARLGMAGSEQSAPGIASAYNVDELLKRYRGV